MLHFFEKKLRESHRFLTYFVLPLILVLPSQAFGVEYFEFYNGIRSLSMGGARIAVVNDETALLVNPAGLGKLRNYFITIVDPEVELGAETQSIVDADILLFMDIQKTVDKLELSPGKLFHEKIQLFPSFVVPNFGIGLFMRYSMDAISKTASPTLYDMDYRNDFAVVTGFNFRLFSGKVKIGFNARAVNRIEVIERDADITQTGLTVANTSSEGFGVGSDIGIILTAPWMWLPTFSVVMRDTGGTHFNLNDGMFHTTATRPNSVAQTIDAAFALFPIASNKSRFAFSGELRDVLNTREDKDTMRRVHVGLEYNLADALFIRVGMHQRYWSAGIEIALFNYQLQIGTYGEEVGVDENNTLEDRRYLLKFSFRF